MEDTFTHGEVKSLMTTVEQLWAERVGHDENFMRQITIPVGKSCSVTISFSTCPTVNDFNKLIDHLHLWKKMAPEIRPAGVSLDEAMSILKSDGGAKDSRASPSTAS